MYNLPFKILTCALIMSVFIAEARSALFKEEVFKTHLRWKFQVKKSDLIITKSNGNVKFETLDLKLFAKIKDELLSYQLPKSYFKSISSSLSLIHI